MTRVLLDPGDPTAFGLEYGQSLQHQPLTPEFQEALEQPRFMENDGLEYATYSFNTQQTVGEMAVPLVVFLPIGKGTASRTSSYWLNALCSQTERQVVTIDTPGTGRSSTPSILDCLRGSLSRVAQTNNQILDKLRIEQAHFMGICLGGAIAAQTAVHRGSLALSLTTFATPGFDPLLVPSLADQKKGRSAVACASSTSDTINKVEAANKDNKAVGFPDISGLPPIAVARFKRRLQYGRIGMSLLGHQAAMQTLPSSLDPATEWHDYVGSHDVLSSWQGHDQAYATREAYAPGTSKLTVLKDTGHHWPLIRPLHVGRLVAQNLG